MIGKSVPRVDAYEKVTGRAKFTDDLILNKCLVARVYHAKIGNGVVKSIDTREAEALDGVVKVVTFKDVPNHCYPTPGHPWSVELAHQDVADSNLLTGRVRYYGDDIAAVVAEDEVTASRALKLIKVEYEEYPVVVSPKISMRGTEHPIHLDKKDNILARSSFAIGDVDSAMEKAAVKLKRSYKTPIVQHCHIENNISYAYMEKGRIVVVSSTQIPHIVRRIVGQALGIPWGQVRVIKPYVGGGFGNKQEVLYEPLNAFLTMQVGGRPVKIELTREETFTNTRTRHSIEYDMEAGVDAVEIHMAHGYLVSTFLSPRTNKRLDEFGGSFENRMRFSRLIIEEVKKMTEGKIAVLARINSCDEVPGGLDVHDSAAIAAYLEGCGLDAIHVSRAVHIREEFMWAPTVTHGGFSASQVEEIKRAVNIPVITVGRYTEPQFAELMVKEGRADLVAFGRQSLADPAMQKKALEERLEDMTPCIACLQGCVANMYAGNPVC